MRIILLLLVLAPVPSYLSQAQVPQPALFDDFEYASDLSDGQSLDGLADRSGSLFGRNDWLTTNGIDSVRAWRRFNWDDLTFTCTRCGADVEGAGRIRLEIRNGGLAGGADHGRLPMIKSGFVTGQGTYASRLRLQAPPEEGNFIQAFWTSASDVMVIEQPEGWIGYMSETDIEAYSPDYTGKGRRDLGVANFLGKRATREGDSFQFYDFIANHDFRVQNNNIQCIDRVQDTRHDLVDCRRVMFDRDWVMSIRIKPRDYVEYAFRSADGRYEAGLVRRTRSSIGVEPVRVRQYAPLDKAVAIFGLYTDDVERKLVSDLVLDVDWYYYTPSILSLDEVLEQVAHWQEVHPRVNTLGVTYHDVNSRSDFRVRIHGPDTVPHNRTGGWRLDLTPLNTTYVAERFEYSFLDCSDSDAVIVHGPVPIRTPEIVLAVPPENDGIVIEATVQNYWSGLERQVRKVVSVEGRDCSVLLGD